MARVFISRNNKDFDVGRELEQALLELGHTMTLKVAAKPAGRWEEQLLRGVHQADAFIPLLTPAGQQSNWVLGQTGMAVSCEYSRNMLVLPVCPKGQIPNFVAAFHCFWFDKDPDSIEGQVSDKDREAIHYLARDLHDAIVAHRAAQPPRIFISHRHRDVEVARKVIELLNSAFHITPHDIRCTSVPGYKLAVGSASADTLLTDLNGAEIVMGLIGPDTSDSEYVLFELGASWGLRKPTFPLRICGAAFKHVPEVLRERSSLSLEDVSQCLQLVEDIGRVCSIERKPPPETAGDADEVRKQADLLAQTAKVSHRDGRGARRGSATV